MSSKGHHQHGSMLSDYTSRILKRTMHRCQLLVSGSTFKPENLGPVAISTIGNLCFTLFVFGVLLFTMIAATYQPEDPLFHPSTKITSFLTSTSDPTFKSDDTVVKTGEDFMTTNQDAFSSFINITDVIDLESDVGEIDRDSTGGGGGDNIGCDESRVNEPIDCTDTEVFHLLMRTAIEKFKDIHFYRFGKPVRGDDDFECHMAWRFRPTEGKAAAFYKDYRFFKVERSENCTLSVVKIGDYHSGGNARKRRDNQKVFEKMPLRGKEKQTNGGAVLPQVGETVNDSLPVVESEEAFSRGKYLIYSGGGDRCKDMKHFLWSFMCALGEAQYLNRTLVMELSICLSKIYTLSHQDEEGKDFRFYFDFEHLRESASVLDQSQFWTNWNKWYKADGLTLHLVEDVRVTPMKLIDVKDALIMRKFGSVEPDNYWYRVCEGETESVVQRPWHLVWKSRRLLDIVSTITATLNWDYDAAHIERGEKAKNKELWPNLDADTSPEALVSTLSSKIEDGRNLYIATNEADKAFFEPLMDKYTTHFLDEYRHLWNETSEWYRDTAKLNNGVPVEFDDYMRISVDTEVFLRGKHQIETFNDLTKDCKDGLNACSAASS